MADYSGITEDIASAMPPKGAEEKILYHHQNEFARVQVQIERQKVYLRWGASVVGLIVLIAAGVLEWIILWHIMDSDSDKGELFFILAISPIAAITVIVIFGLIGVFRGFEARDMRDLPTSSLLRMLIKSDS